ncbi:MAG: helix-turn-helix domain-containing protein [Bacteroidales bacterium]|nr:helix-turn-helix domain-containing protein [Bacteroidales bacterium]
MEQVFFNVPLVKLEPIFKRWVRDVIQEREHQSLKLNATEPAKQLLTIDEAAELLHLRTPTIYSKVSRGELPGVSKRNNRLYFDKQVLIDWIKSGSKKTSSEVEAEAEAFLNSQRKGVR